jgi:glycosyltransferase involved in cell wall biosynthesis
MSSKECLDILKKATEFEIENIKINFSKSMETMGKITLSKLKELIDLKKKVKENLKNFNPEIVYFMPATARIGLIREYLLFKEIKKKKKKIIYHIRARISKENRENYFIEKIYIKMFKNQKAIVLDESLKEDLKGLIKEEDIFVLPNSIKNEISSKEFRKIIEKRKNKKEMTILFLSNMDKSKGWLKLLEACKILKEKKINFSCNFVGAWVKNQDEKEFKEFVKKNNLKEINYLGKKIDKEKNEVLEKSDILVFPTEHKLETFGRVIIEAMMFGIPVIANGIASIPTTIINNKTGFVLKENSPKEIAEKIEILLKDKEKANKMGEEGRKRFLEYYEQKEYGKKFREILKKV